MYHSDGELSSQSEPIVTENTEVKPFLQRHRREEFFSKSDSNSVRRRNMTSRLGSLRHVTLSPLHVMPATVSSSPVVHFYNKPFELVEETDAVHIGHGVRLGEVPVSKSQPLTSLALPSA